MRSFVTAKNLIVYCVNAIAGDPYEIINNLKSVYPYETTYNSRKRLCYFVRAEITSRVEPRNVFLRSFTLEGSNSQHPLVSVSQCGWGEVIDMIALPIFT